MSPSLIGVLSAASGLGILALALFQRRHAFWFYLGAVLLAGGCLILVFLPHA